MKKNRHRALTLLCIVLFALNVSAQSTEFTYQGNLKDGTSPANGNYDFEFRLFAVENGGAAVGTLSRPNVAVTAGAFAVTLDFGAQFPGAGRWLETSVKPAGGGSFQILLPRSQINSTPYSVKSLNAENAAQLGGVAANQYVVTTDPRMTDSRTPLAGSSDYIQNSTSPQAAGNFNITGSGTLGGKLSAQTVNATTRFELGNARILGVAAGGNLYVGLGAGAGVTTGQLNTFVGSEAGLLNTIGAANSFFGISAGRNQVEGFSNSFFGRNAGMSNVSSMSNSYFGAEAGAFGTAGDRNSFFGGGAGWKNAGSDNAFFGTGAGSAQGSGSFNAFFGASSGVNNVSINNSFFGAFSGFSNVNGGNHAFFGYQAGFNNTGGCCNAIFGSQAGKQNTGAASLSLFGYRAGEATTICCNSFFGSEAGELNTIGWGNVFVGVLAAGVNTTGSHNTVVGAYAGANNTTGSGNSFFGRDSGLGSTTGDNNTYIGHDTGQANGGFRVGNTAIGAFAKTANDVSTAIGYRAFVEGYNSVVLGSIAGVNGASENAKVGIGVTMPEAPLHIRYNGGDIKLGHPFSCNPGFAGIGFGPTFTCQTYSMLGGDGNTVINRPGGGVIQFREGNAAQITINSGGTMSINALGSAGLIQLCRNFSNTISTCSSSLRYKTSVSAFTPGISFIERLRPISFTWKDGGVKDVGFGAEDIAAIDTRFVTYNDKGEVEGVKYDRLGVVFVNAFREQQQTIERQQKQIDALTKAICEIRPTAAVCQTTTEVKK